MATQKQPKLIRRACGTMGAHMLLLERYPAFRARQQRLESETNRRRALGFTAAELKLAKIKVVVNVVYKDPSQNISDAQINGQIKALNLDFRAKNSDKKKTPAVWSGLVADSQVEFVLYRVTRTQTTQSSYNLGHRHFGLVTISEPMTESNARRRAASRRRIRAATSIFGFARWETGFWATPNFPAVQNLPTAW